MTTRPTTLELVALLTAHARGEYVPPALLELACLVLRERERKQQTSRQEEDK